MLEAWQGLEGLLEVLGVDEPPMALLLADEAPDEAYHPVEMDLPTVEKEKAGQIDYEKLQANFSCAMSHIWLARKKKKPAYFSASNFGCPGAAFWLGFNKPQIQSIIHYVSSGIPGQMEGEHYLDSPEVCSAVFDYADPATPPKPYVVIKPLEITTPDEQPQFFTFFCRPESLAGLHQLASYVDGSAEAVRSPFAPGCGSLWAWPMHYQAQGISTAVLGGWDPSARKFYKTDELSFTVPPKMFGRMCSRWPDSFLTREAWKVSRAKAARSSKTWGKG
jgi:uncharacterized protein (DUF169 family)